MVTLRELTTGSLERLVGEGGLLPGRGIRALLEAHPVVLSQEDGVLHVPAGTTQAHYARAAAGIWRRISWMLKRIETEVERGAEVPEAPHERGELWRSQASVAD